ncbi:POTRA domain-containing protein [Mangrovimonas cancribranchiae]|uniref:POTRA domain-containing protein n=1 Tax=Mangrovimonas cancribranchiae TaxID=3080055 RepID=A0AAU6P1X4_9FLAO
MLQITSKDSLETQTINRIGYKNKHNNFKSVTNEINKLKTTLINNGYIGTKTSSVKKTTDSLITCEMLLGNKIDSVKIFFNEENSIKTYLNEITRNTTTKDYIIIPFEETQNTLEQLSAKIVESGDPFSTVKLTEHVINKNTLKAHLTLTQKAESRKIDKIIVKGYKKFPKAYLKHNLKIKEGDVFNLNSTKKKLSNLDQLRFSSQIKDPEVLFTKDSTILYVYLKKTKSNNFDGFLGFGTNEESGNLEFNGYLNLDLNNNLNLGESFSLIYKSDENEQRTFNANLKIPYIFNSPIGVQLQLNLFKKDSSFTTASQNAKLLYQLNAKNEISAGVKSIKSNNLLSNTSNFTPIEDYESFFYNIGYLHQNIQTNNRLFPVSTYINLELGTGYRNSEEKNEQHNIFIDTYKIFNLNRKNSVFIKANGGYLISNNYLENELYRFGGINSIRGFKENSLAANLYGVINTEYRYSLSQSIYLHTIIDFSYLENDIVNQKEKLYGFGLGFGILTKAGLLKFNYANGKTEAQKFKFSNSQVHLSLTSFF